VLSRRTIGGTLATIIATVTLAGGAQAKAPAATDAVVWDAVPVGPSHVLIFGGLASVRPKCVVNRKFKFVFHFIDGGTAVVDRGRSSDEGAWSATWKPADFTSAPVDHAVLVIAKSKGCAKAAVTPSL
jgi:hypothetical protein